MLTVHNRGGNIQQRSALAALPPEAQNQVCLVLQWSIYLWSTIHLKGCSQTSNSRLRICCDLISCKDKRNQKWACWLPEEQQEIISSRLGCARVSVPVSILVNKTVTKRLFLSPALLFPQARQPQTGASTPLCSCPPPLSTCNGPAPISAALLCPCPWVPVPGTCSPAPMGPGGGGEPCPGKRAVGWLDTCSPHLWDHSEGNSLLS